MSKRPDHQPDIQEDKPAWWARVTSPVTRAVSRIARTVSRVYEALDEGTSGLLPHLVQAWHHFDTRDYRQAASLAYYALFSAFPLILLSVTLVSGLVGPALAQEQVLELVGSFFPADTMQLIEENVQLALEQRESFGLVAAGVLIWSSLSLFSNLTAALDNIFHPTFQRPMWHKRGLALLMAIVLAVLLFGSVITSVIFQLLSVVAMAQPSAILTILTLALPLGLNVAIFALLFRNIPQMHVRWDAIWPAAVLGGIGWELSKRLFVWYINNFANYSVIYGSLGTVIVLLFWAYLSAAILLLAADVCAAINQWLAEKEAQEAD